MLNDDFERIEFECLRTEINAGVVVLPEEGVSACMIEIDPSLPRRSVNVRDLPIIVCLGCRALDSSRSDGVTVWDGGPPHKIIGSNPEFHQTRINNSCMVEQPDI